MADYSNEGATIQENVSLKSFNTFGINVYSRYFVEVDSEPALLSALRFADDNLLPKLFLGGGSNILFTQDFSGIVIKLDLKGVSEEIINEEEVLITAKAGENWHQFVTYCLERDYGGLENLSLIPGNVGTSPMQNIGAYGVEIKDTFYSCKALNLETRETEIFTAERCAFGYRESFFKKEGKGKYVILEVTFRLSTKNHHIKTTYGAIQAELEAAGVEVPTIQQVSKAVINIRQSKLPDPQVTGNAGSFFKNPVISAKHYESLAKEFPAMPSYPAQDGVKVPAGWLIEQCGWKGKQIGHVASHPLQALVIINATGKATGKGVYDFSERIIESVNATFGITLEREVNIR